MTVDLRTFWWIHDKIRKDRLRNKETIDNLTIIPIKEHERKPNI